MGIKFGTIDITGVNLGTTNISEVYFGNTLVFASSYNIIKGTQNNCTITAPTSASPDESITIKSSLSPSTYNFYQFNYLRIGTSQDAYDILNLTSLSTATATPNDITYTYSQSASNTIYLSSSWNCDAVFYTIKSGVKRRTSKLTLSIPVDKPSTVSSCAGRQIYFIGKIACTTSGYTDLYCLFRTMVSFTCPSNTATTVSIGTFYINDPTFGTQIFTVTTTFTYAGDSSTTTLGTVKAIISGTNPSTTTMLGFNGYITYCYVL